MRINRRKALFLGVDTLAALVVAKVGAARPSRAGASSALPDAGAAVTLADDFTPLGTTEIIGRTIQDSAGIPYTWTQLFPSPAWRSGPRFSTGDPGIVNGKLIRRPTNPITAMYPGLVLPGVPAHVEVDFFFDPSGIGGRSVFIHLFADTDGTRTTTEIPFHLSVGEKGFAVKAMSTIAGDTELTGFGTFPDTGNETYASGVKLAYGVKHTVKLDMDGNTVTITFPPATGTPPKTLTDPRLTSARHPGGGPGRFLVLEDEADLANEPYNGFYAVRIVLGSSGGGIPPAITAIAPAARGQGAKNQLVTVTGTGFATGAVASVSGNGVTIVSQNRLSATEIQLRASVAANAALGARTLTVTNTDGGTASAPFSVTAKPLPTSASPPAPRGSTTAVTITGKNFVSGSGLKVQVVGAGITTGAANWLSATTITVPVTVQSTANAGAYKVTVTNPDGGKGSRANCLTVT